MSDKPEFALFGGPPRFVELLHVGQINVPPWDEIVAEFSDIFDRRYYANHGPLVARLEQEYAQATGCRHAVAMANGTLALMAMAVALNLRDEVIVPTFTFPATVQALSWAGVTPVLCDVDAETHMLTEETVRPLIRKRTSGILGVHLWGKACDPETLQALAEEHGLTLCFDASHGAACSYRGENLGNFGVAASVSFHATKILGAAEGGCVTTNDDEVAARLKTVRSFHSGETLADVSLRINAKMSEAQAALALLNIRHLDRYVAENRARYLAYRHGMNGIPGIRLVELDAGNNFQYVVIDVDAEQAGLDRDSIFDLLNAENVFCRRYFYPGVHAQMPYRDDPAVRNRSFPVSDSLSSRLLQLPNGQAITLDNVENICCLVRDLISESGRVRTAMEDRV